MTASATFSARQPFIDGAFVEGDGGLLRVDNPATEELVAEVETCSPNQSEQAIIAARRAFDDGRWCSLTRHDRAATVLAMADYFDSHRDELAATVQSETGSTTHFLRTAQIGMPLAHLRQAVELYLSLPEEEPTPRPLADALSTNTIALSVLRYEPVGVVSAITAYNAPLWINTWKVVPALLAGNTVVLHPSPFTPLSALAFAEAAAAAGLPDGVLNVLVEEGQSGAQLMTTHPAVDQVSFTGSTHVGSLIAQQCAATVKRVMLELGGKSVQLYLPDAVNRAGGGCALVFGNNSGQACIAPTRMLVPVEHKEDVLQACKATAEALPVGDPLDPRTVIGPLISAAQRDKCEHYVRLAQEHGAKIVSGGRRPNGLDRGYYFEPTVLDVPDNSNPAAQDEIFGPIVSVLGYESIDHAVDIANDSRFGLSGQVYSADLRAATDVAARIRAGAVQVNGGTTHAFAPSGGYKQSGYGRERGVDGIRAYQQIKHVSVAGG